MNTAANSVTESGSAQLKDSIRIALVEDDPMFRQAVEHYLKKIPGNRVFTFSSGEECFRHYHQLDPEILILDYKLDASGRPEVMNGLEILEEVKAVDPNKEILFLSSQENLDVATAAIKGGASAYIIKDEKAMNRLLDEVRAMLANIRLRREEARNGKRILALAVIAGALFIIADLSGFGWFTLPVKILFGLVAFTAGLIILSTKDKNHIAYDEHASNEEKPGDWLD